MIIFWVFQKNFVKIQVYENYPSKIILTQCRTPSNRISLIFSASDQKEKKKCFVYFPYPSSLLCIQKKRLVLFINTMNECALQSSKGSLISESFSHRLKSPKQKVPNHDPELILFLWIVPRIVICHFLSGDLSQVKNFLRLSHL